MSSCSVGLCNQRSGCHPGTCCQRRFEQRLHGGAYNRTLYTHHHTEPPALLLLYHIEKTGGTSVMTWLEQNIVRKTPRLDAVVPYQESAAFICASFGGLLGRSCRDGMGRGLTICDRHAATPHASPLRARIAVEFHAMGWMAFFLETVAPALPRLREVYAAAGGKVLTATVVREPLSHIFSAYRMWPPQGVPGDFMGWAEGVEAAQAGLLVTERAGVLHTRFSPRRRGMHSSDVTLGRRCSILPEARARLSTFDVVGVTSCLASFLRAVETGLRLQPAICRSTQQYSLSPGGGLVCTDRRAASWRSRGLQDPPLNYSLRNVPSTTLTGPRLRPASLRAAQRARIEEITRCDAQLYADAVALAVRNVGPEAPTCQPARWSWPVE